jgi:hypothetical protein
LSVNWKTKDRRYENARKYKCFVGKFIDTPYDNDMMIIAKEAAVNDKILLLQDNLNCFFHRLER